MQKFSSLRRHVFRYVLVPLCICVAAVGVLLGCSHKAKPPSPFGAADGETMKWPFEPAGIQLLLKADPELNQYNNRPHALVMCIYQLKNQNAFEDLAKAEKGVVTLLGCSRFDPSVADSQRIIMQPNEARTVVLDRAEDTRYVGLVAGYYSLGPSQATKLYPVPVTTTVKGLMFKTTYRKPGRLDMEVLLGAQEVKHAQDNDSKGKDSKGSEKK